MKRLTQEERLERAKIAIEEIAAKEGKTVDQIRLSMKEAMIVGLLNPDPKVQAMWKSIPCSG